MTEDNTIPVPLPDDVKHRLDANGEIVIVCQHCGQDLPAVGVFFWLNKPFCRYTCMNIFKATQP